MSELEKRKLKKTIKRYIAASLLTFVLLVAVEYGVTMLLNGFIPDYSMLLIHAICSLLSASVTLYLGYRLLQKRMEKIDILRVSKPALKDYSKTLNHFGEKR